MKFAESGIHVNAAAPGPMRSKAAIAAGGEAFERAGRITPIGRMVSHDEIAEAALFLASARSAYATSLAIDGGRTIK